jgi:hypothetical protein
MFQDSLIPNSVYYLPLLKRMTDLNGPVRVTLEEEHSEAVKVTAPDGYTARLEVMLEDYRVAVELGDEAYDFQLATNEDIKLTQQAVLVAAIKAQLLYDGYDLAEKAKTDDGVVLMSVSLGAGTPKPQDRPELMLWLETWLAEMEKNAERRKARAIRSAAHAEMDRKREAARLAAAEAARREAELEEARARKASDEELDEIQCQWVEQDRLDSGDVEAETPDDYLAPEDDQDDLAA